MGYSSEIESKLKLRTRRFGLACIRIVQSLKRDPVADTIGRQLVRCGTSVGANYRSACRSRSRAEMIARLSVVEDEADESTYWIDMLVDADLVERSRVSELRIEGEEILRIVVSSIRTLKSNADCVHEENAVYNAGGRDFDHSDYDSDLTASFQLILNTPKSKLQTPN